MSLMDVTAKMAGIQTLGVNHEGSARNRETTGFAEVLAAENTHDAVAERVKAEAAATIAAHNAAVLAMAGEVPDPKQEFLDFMNKTPEERMRIQILLSLGLTEEEFEALSPEDQLKVEQKIVEVIRENALRNLEEAAASSEREKDGQGSLIG